MSKTEISKSNIVSEEYHQELQAKGLAIYESELKSELEPAHNGEYIVIHVDTADYALGKTYREAKMAIKARHPTDGRLLGFKIGPEPDTDYVARLIAGDLAARHTGKMSQW